MPRFGYPKLRNAWSSRCRRNKLDELLKLCQSEDVQVAVIGEFTDDRRLKLFYKGHQVADLAMKFLHGGIPAMAIESRNETAEISRT